MSLRSRLAIAFAVLATVVAALMGVIGYASANAQLERETDRSLVAGGRPMLMAPDDRSGGRTGQRRQDAALLLAPDGQVVQARGDAVLPVTDADRAAAAGTQPTRTARTKEVDGVPYRIVTVAPGDAGGALLVARDWSENAAVLQQLAVVLTAFAVALAGLAAVVGWWVATSITRRLVHLTDAAEHVGQTGQLEVAVPGAGTDEVGRLAAAFNTMLDRLAASQADQKRLVQDAGHELRTPLTSLRTNISLLHRLDELPPDARARVLADLEGESRELTGLVNEVLDLAAGEADSGDPEAVRLADVARAVAARAHRRTGRDIDVQADDSTVMTHRSGVERAVWNLVENAVKFDPGGAPIEIRVSEGTLEVLDRGPGVDPADATRLFDRFYRPVASRSQPGSGLGLSIVKDVVEASGGRVYVTGRDGGGSVFGMAFPTR
jgi:two-component system sensor histidine kinase MprB